MGRRSVLVAAGWLGAAVLAVLAGLGAVSVIGHGLTGKSTPAYSAAEVARQLAAVTPPPPASSSLGASPGPTNRTDNKVKPTRGGTVVARCAGSLAEIVTMTPELGFAVHEKTDGPRAEAEGEFRSSSDNHDRVRIRVTCAGGTPEISAADKD